MNKNVSIVVVLLVLVVIVGYLIWIRSQIAPTVSPKAEEEIQATPTPIQSGLTSTATPSATSGAPPAGRAGKEATGSMKQKVSTPSSTGR